MFSPNSLIDGYYTALGLPDSRLTIDSCTSEPIAFTRLVTLLGIGDALEGFKEEILAFHGRLMEHCKALLTESNS